MKPWDRRQLLALGLLNAIGLVLLVVAWNTNASAPDLADHAGSLNLGIAGLLLASAADVGWLLQGRRAVLERRGHLFDE